MWRGSTIDKSVKPKHGADPKKLFEDVWNVDLQIYRAFKGRKPIDEERPWIEAGGILFYSIQPKGWADYAENGSKDDVIIGWA